MTDELRAGLYRHYKGPLYMVLGLAHDANADTLYSPMLTEYPESNLVVLGEREVVVYVPLYNDDAHTGPRMAVRTLDDFFAWVHDQESSQEFGTECKNFALHNRTGAWCHCGDYPESRIVRRFEYVGLRYEG